jgi:hypothetical protein
MKWRYIRTLRQLELTAQYCSRRYSSSGTLTSSNETALSFCIKREIISPGSDTAPNKIPDEAPGLVFEGKMGADESTEISMNREKKEMENKERDS